MGLIDDLWPLALIGLFNGAIYALAAMGVVLTYKTSGIFNFAYGAVAMFCGFTFWQFRDGWHISSWIALPLVLFVVAPVIGVLSERLFRPLTALSAEIQIVVSLGVLAFLQALVPLLFGAEDRFLGSIFPSGTFAVTSRLNVSWTQLCTLILAVAMGGGLYLLLRRTKFGIATQAVVDNRDLAELIGVSGDAVSRVAWIISSVFAALVGILLSANSRLDVYTLVLVVIYAFAPAVLGRLVSLPLAFGGAIFLGVLQGVLAHWGSTGVMAEVEASIPYLALFALLLFYGGRLKELRSSFEALGGAAAVRVKSRRRFWGTAGGLGAVALVLPAILNDSLLGNVTSGAVYATIALTLIVLTGWSGQISLAQFSFVGVGAFTAGHLAGPHGGGFFAAALLGAVIAVPLGLIVGLPSLRLSGLYLALATMAFALTLDTLVFSQRSISGGLTGMTVSRPSFGSFSFASTTRFYYLAVALLAVFAVGAALLRAGPVGRRLQMMRDAPVAAATFGVNLTLTKLAVFAMSGAAAALAGALFGSLRRSISPNDFAFGASLGLLLLVVLGGRALVGGAVVAGVVYTLQIVPASVAIHRYIPLAVAIGVVVLAKYPDGPITVAGEQTRRYGALFRPLPRPVPPRAEAARGT
jgi:branched-chain amino acid transport system permease protein